MITKTILTLGIVAGFVIGISFSSVYAGIPWGTDDIANNAITSVKIADSNVKSGDIKNGEVRSVDIKNNNIKGKDIMEGTIVSSDIADGTITTADIKDGTVGPFDLKNLAVHSNHIDLSAIGAPQIAQDAVGASEIAPNAVGLSEMDVTITRFHAVGTHVVDMIPTDGKSFCFLTTVATVSGPNDECDIDFLQNTNWELHSTSATCLAVCIQFGV